MKTIRIHKDAKFEYDQHYHTYWLKVTEIAIVTDGNSTETIVYFEVGREEQVKKSGGKSPEELYFHLAASAARQIA